MRDSKFQAMVARRHFRGRAVSTKITFQDISGEPVSGRFEASEGLITVTLSDGTSKTVDIQESMLSPETLAKMLLLQSIGPSGQTQTAKICLRISGLEKPRHEIQSSGVAEAPSSGELLDRLRQPRSIPTPLIRGLS